jgi:hypothetical protein
LSAYKIQLIIIWATTYQEKFTMKGKLNVSFSYLKLIKFSEVLVLKISKDVDFTWGIAIKIKKSQIHLSSASRLSFQSKR